MRRVPPAADARYHGGYRRRANLCYDALPCYHHAVDYRSLYVTVARRWWGISGDFLQGRSFPMLDCLT